MDLELWALQGSGDDVGWRVDFAHGVDEFVAIDGTLLDSGGPAACN